MKKLIICSSLSALFLLMTAFSYNSFPHLKAKTIQQDYAKVNDKLYFGKFEVSNGDYKTFINSLKENNQKDLYTKCLPNTSQWKKDGQTEPNADSYYSSNSFDKYPVVTVEYDAAIEYCKWLTQQYNSDANRQFHKVLFRLPTEQEWTFAANGGDNSKIYTWNTPYMHNQKGEFFCQFLRLGDNAITYDNQTKTYKVVESNNIKLNNGLAIPGPINSFNPNQFGLYNMCGNAAEMIFEKGIAKGGSYNDPGYDVRIASSKAYTDSSPEIGFRVVMEIVIK